MKARFASGLFRLWVVLTMLWLAAAGVNIVVLYQTVPQHALIKGRIAFDDLIPAYEHCWKSSDGKEVNIDDFISDKDFAQIAGCETAVDRWEIVRNDDNNACDQHNEDNSRDIFHDASRARNIRR